MADTVNEERVRTAFPDARDDLAIRVMFQMLQELPSLYRDEKYVAARSYLIADAMIANSKAGA